VNAADQIDINSGKKLRMCLGKIQIPRAVEKGR
jgi:hypothetical protein